MANFTDLKYIVEIDKRESISLAARELYVAQSNLSRSVKRVEEKYGLLIFERTPRGVVTTREGQSFINQAKEILYEVDNLTSSYIDCQGRGTKLKISIPRASYISDVFIDFMHNLEDRERFSIHYDETNSLDTIRNVLDFEYDMGIIRYNFLHEGYFLSLLKLKNLRHSVILEFDYLLLTSRESSIAGKHIRADEDLAGCTELVYGDKRLPSGEYVDLTDKDREESQDRVIYIYERSSVYEILSRYPDTYMWVSPVPQEILDRYNLVQMRCGAYADFMKDVLIYKANRPLRDEKKEFVKLLREKVREYGCYF